MCTYVFPSNTDPFFNVYFKIFRYFLSLSFQCFQISYFLNCCSKTETSQLTCFIKQHCKDVDFVEFYTRTLNQFIVSITIAYFFFIFLYLVFRLVDNSNFGCKREGCIQRFETLIFFITKITLTFI